MESPTKPELIPRRSRASMSSCLPIASEQWLTSARMGLQGARSCSGFVGFAAVRRVAVTGVRGGDAGGSWEGATWALLAIAPGQPWARLGADVVRRVVGSSARKNGSRERRARKSDGLGRRTQARTRDPARPARRGAAETPARRGLPSPSSPTQQKGREEVFLCFPCRLHRSRADGSQCFHVGPVSPTRSGFQGCLLWASMVSAPLVLFGGGDLGHSERRARRNVPHRVKQRFTLGPWMRLQPHASVRLPTCLVLPDL